MRAKDERTNERTNERKGHVRGPNMINTASRRPVTSPVLQERYSSVILYWNEVDFGRSFTRNDDCFSRFAASRSRLSILVFFRDFKFSIR